MRSYLRTDTGKVRKRNEDQGFADPRGLYIVADGMGGHAAGDVASDIAVAYVKDALSGREPSVRLLMDAVRGANRAVYEAAQNNPDWGGMGTTMTILWVDADLVYLAQVGDSRAYLLRGGVLHQCTQDHTMVAELLRTRRITKAQARRHPQRNLITRVIGVQEEVTPDLFEWPREAGDIWLLCSDGLYAMVPDEEILDILLTQPLPRATDALLKAALDHGGHDNITILTVHDREGVSP